MNATEQLPDIPDTPWVLPEPITADEYQREAIETAQSEAAAQAMTEKFNRE